MLRTCFFGLFLVSCLFVPLSSPAAEGEKDDYLSVRREVVRLYGSSPASELLRLCERNRRDYRDNERSHSLFRAAALAELAGNSNLRDDLLLEILTTQREGMAFLQHCIESFRADGTLTSNIEAILAAVAPMGAEDRLQAARILARTYAWHPPPAGIDKLAREQLAKEPPAADLAHFAAILAGWGHRGEATELLAARGLAARTDLPERADLVAVLAHLGAVREARQVAEESISRFLPSPPPPGIPRADLFMTRQARFSRLVEIAQAGAAWDILLAGTSAAGEDPGAGILDRAVVADAVGMPIEAAEQLDSLRKAKPGPRADALYAGALNRAGDAFTARRLLLAAVMKTPQIGEDAYFDLLDSLTVLRDAPTIESFATIYSLAFPEPQHARAMTEWLRALGAFASSDRLFQSSITATGIGPDTRFAWQGGRLLAEYYLDTGRLEEGRKTAREALENLLTQERLADSWRSREPEEFVALFARFGGAEELYEYCRKSESQSTGGILLNRIKQEALEHLGRWEQALETQEALTEGFDPVSRDLYRAAAHARAGLFDEAARGYEKAIAADPNVPKTARDELVRIYAELGRWGDIESYFSELAGKVKPELRGNTWLEVAAVMAHYAQASRASRAYARLDDLTAPFTSRQLGPAVRFWVGAGEPETAAAALARRIAIQETFDAKIDYLNECLPSENALAAGYLEMGEKLQQGPPALDGNLLAHFYRELGRRCEHFLDPLNALTAYSRARDLEPENPGNQLLVCLLTSQWRPEQARAAAAAFLARLPDNSVAIERIRADFALADRESAEEGLAAVLDAPLKIPQIAQVVDILESANPPRPVFEKAARAGRGWPWVLRARLASAAVLSGHEQLGLAVAEEVEKDGGYIGRALWAARTYLQLGLAEKAGKACDDYAGRAGAHPAAALLKADFALAQDRDEAAMGIFTGARAAFSVKPIAALFDAEIARLSR